MSSVVNGQIKYRSMHSVELFPLASHPVCTASSNTDNMGRSSMKSGPKSGFFSCFRFHPDLFKSIEKCVFQELSCTISVLQMIT